MNHPLYAELLWLKSPAELSLASLAIWQPRRIASALRSPFGLLVGTRTYTFISGLSPRQENLFFRVTLPGFDVQQNFDSVLTLPGFDVHQNFDSVLMNGGRNGEGNGTESAIHG